MEPVEFRGYFTVEQRKEILSIIKEAECGWSETPSYNQWIISKTAGGSIWWNRISWDLGIEHDPDFESFIARFRQYYRQ